jgi:hypothetical protein
MFPAFPTRSTIVDSLPSEPLAARSRAIQGYPGAAEPFQIVEQSFGFLRIKPSP